MFFSLYQSKICLKSSRSVDLSLEIDFGLIKGVSAPYLFAIEAYLLESVETITS